ncbi:MAG: MFS transporter, partial [Rhodospirillales bacterium]|nr:MFS transporter [Rhodospirillales bacterium]
MKPDAVRGLVIWLITTLFLIYENLLNTMFGLVARDVGTDLAIDAVQLGVLAAAFVYAYGAMQVPVGV